MTSRWTRLHIPTLRDEPAGIASAGERLLRRAGYLRDAGWLPLGVRCMRRLESAALRELAIGPASETADLSDPEGLLAGDLRSYKQLPRILFARQAGTLTVCEVAMGEPALKVPAAIPEFIAYESGPDSLLEAGGYSAMAESAVSTACAPVEPDPPEDRKPELVATPDQKTIADVATFLGVPETSLIKTLVLVADGEPVLALLRGDHSLSVPKLAAVLGVNAVRGAVAEEIARLLGANAGSLGPVGARDVRIVADSALEGRRNMISGANKDDFHLRFVTPGKDFACEYRDLRLARAGELGENGLPLAERRGAAIAKLRTRAANRLRVLNDLGKEAVPAVSLLTIHTEHALRAFAETSADKDGLVLPAALAPFDVVITPVNVNDAALREAADSIAAACSAAGLDVLLDDRDERPGVKFKDADLIGVPARINVGKKIAEGKVEIVNRRTKETRDAAPEEVARLLAE